MSHDIRITDSFLNEVMAESVVVQGNPQIKILNERDEKISMKDKDWMQVQNKDTIPLDLPKMIKNSTQVVEEIEDPEIYRWEGGAVPDIISVANSLGNPSFFNEEQIQCVQLKLVREKDQPNKIYEKEGHGMTVTVGRGSKNDLVINDKLSSISSQHAVINWNEVKKSWFLSDSNSKNGSFLVIDNSQIREKDTLAIGLYLCSISELTFGLISCFLKLQFQNMADDNIESFEITTEIKDEDQFFIGKAHQHNLSEDPMMADNQCYFKWESQKRRLKVFQCEEARFPISKAVKPGKTILLKNNDTIRFGLMNFYSFVACSKIIKPPAGKGNQTSSGEECLICFETQKRICVLNPCNHSGICMDCVIRICERPVQKCPFCNALFEDFIEKVVK